METPKKDITNLIPKPTFGEYIIAGVIIFATILFGVTVLLSCIALCKYLISFIFFS